mmetsp:Transcript_71568/g.119893  ORF Transcript_71568/g.119893 Transcript_71568/m.119893 type:complete len:375 (+) Transcript_71568:874-1998(+)
MVRTSSSSFCVYSVVARPAAPARAVRPMRCRWSTAFPANSYWTTCATCGRSSPRAASPEHTSSGSSPALKRARRSRRSSSGNSFVKISARCPDFLRIAHASATPSIEFANTSAGPAATPPARASRSARGRVSRSTSMKRCSIRVRVLCSSGVSTHVAAGQRFWSMRLTLRVPALGTVAPTKTCCSRGAAGAAPCLAQRPASPSTSSWSSGSSSAPSCSAAKVARAKCFSSTSSRSMGYDMRFESLKLPDSSVSTSSSTTASTGRSAICSQCRIATGGVLISTSARPSGHASSTIDCTVTASGPGSASASRWATSKTCAHRSRLGCRIRTRGRGPSPALRMRCSCGTRYARVLPMPVSPASTASPPSQITGKPAA